VYRSNEADYTYDFDGKDYPMVGSANYDTLSAERINARTVKSTEKRAGKTVGIAILTISPDGKLLTIKDDRVKPKGRTILSGSRIR
jgi:hypothetical protein